MARLTIKLEASKTKQKHDWLVNASDDNKRAKKSRAFDFYLFFGPVLIAGKKISQLRDLPLLSFDFSILLTFQFFFLGIGQGVFPTNIFCFFSSTPQKSFCFFIN